MTQGSTKEADVIVVLGAAVWPNAKLSPSLFRRVIKAVELFKLGYSKNIIMSGRIGKHPPPEALLMKKLAVENGVPEDAIIVDVDSYNTYDSAINCSTIMEQYNWHSVGVFSDSYHLTRSTLLFRFLGIATEGISPDEGRGETRLWKWTFYHVRELAAIPWYAIRLVTQALIMKLWPNCWVPDDCIGTKIGSLLRAREVMELLVSMSIPENAQ